MHRWSITAAAITVALAAFTSRSSASESDGGPFHPDDVTEGLAHDLVRVLVSEGGFDDPREHDALAWTLSRRAATLRRTRGWSARRTLRAIADRALVEPRTDRQRWLHRLELHGGAPRGWGELTTVPWGRRADRYKAVVERVRAFMRGEVADPCEGPSELWGSRTHPVDRRALVRNVCSGTWVVVDCGLEGGARDNVYVRWGTRAERQRAERTRACGRQPRLRVRYVD